VEELAKRKEVFYFSKPAEFYCLGKSGKFDRTILVNGAVRVAAVL
jgi:hypothetical protein